MHGLWILHALEWQMVCGRNGVFHSCDWGSFGRERGARRSKSIAHKEKGKTMESKEIMRVDLRDETGATTAEYAITTLAACGFAALLVVLLKSEPINNILLNLMQTALGMGQ